MNAESSVKERYASAAQAREQELCCPVQYNAQYLQIIPQEVLEKDYGCGDPSAYLLPGETVLDLGSGAGKICFIAAQVVGPSGRVIGVDMTDEMLAVARRNAPVLAERLGYSNVDFYKGRIQDLALDLDLLEQQLSEKPITGSSSFLQALEVAERLRKEQPLVADQSIDAVVSNCVLNLVDPAAKSQLFHELFRVLKVGGRAIISDIVADREVPMHLQRDPVLYSGCISGAFTETAFIQAFEAAGFHGIELAKHEEEPWRTVEGIDFRAVTVIAYKGRVTKEEPVQSGIGAIYRGPFKTISDDQGCLFRRGELHNLTVAQLELLTSPPYAGHFAFVETAPLPEPASPTTSGASSDSVLGAISLPRLSARKNGNGKCC